MSFLSWVASASGKRRSAIGSGLRKPKGGSRKPPRFRPQLEALEDETPNRLPQGLVAVAVDAQEAAGC
jgi:hypothetical protein